MPVTLKRLATDIQLPPLPDAVRWTAPAEGRVAEEEIEFSWAGETARHVGIVVHWWLQRIAEDELRGWNAKRIESLKATFTKQLLHSGVAGSETRNAVVIVSTALRNAIVDDRGRWLLGPHLMAKSEYRIRAVVNGQTRSYVIDRLFRTESDELWIVDYKISGHEGADISAFLDRERQRYDGQLQQYVSALGLAGVRVGLYFPTLKEWRGEI